MLAELVTEVVCREIARQGTSRGRFISVSGFEADAIQREYLRLQNLHAASIHAHNFSEQVVLQEDPRSSEVLSGQVIIEGRQVGAEAILTATCNETKAEGFVKVISKRITVPQPSPKKKSGLFDDIRFDEDADPRHRVRMNNRTIIVSLSAPSVSPYIRP